MGNYVHLHLHGEGSFLDGAIRIKELPKRVLELGMDAVAVTEHGSMYTMVKHYKACMEAGIKPILGCEVYVAEDRLVKVKRIKKTTKKIAKKKGKKKKKDEIEEEEFIATEVADSEGNSGDVAGETPQEPPEEGEASTGESGKNYHLVLLAATNEGLENLIKIVSDASLTGFYYKPRTDLSFLREHGKGIIALSACRAGQIPFFLAQGNVEKATEIARAYSEIFDEFYIEIQASDTIEQARSNKQLIEFARANGYPLVVTSDAHYLLQEDAQAQDILLAIQTGALMVDPNRFKMDSMCYWLKSEDETREFLKREFADVIQVKTNETDPAGEPVYSQVAEIIKLDDDAIEESIVNTVKIAEKCNVELPLERILFPAVDLPEGKTANQVLVEKAYEGLDHCAAEWGWDYEKYKERLDYEIQVVSDAGLDAYFLMVQDIVQEGLRRGIPHGPGRGSAGGALLAMVLGITDIDPIKHDLSFERFWVPGRKGMPDIDMDWSPNRRKELMQYLIDKYGMERCAHIGTVGKLQPRSLVRDIGRTLGIPLVEVDAIAKTIPESIEDEDSGDKIEITIASSLEESEELQAWEEKYPFLFEIAGRLEGLPRHTSIHAAGIVVAPIPLFGQMPLSRSKKEEDPLPVTMLDMGDVEELGFIKFDLLSVEALTTISETQKAIKERHGLDIDLLKIDYEDPKVYKELCALHTFGIFQVCTKVGKQMVHQIQPTHFNDLVDILALARPGPMKSGQDKEYVMCKNGIKAIEYLHNDLIPLLSSTYGQMIYQEQTMAITRIIGGFDHAGADKFRKGMAKKHPEIIAEIKQKFLDGSETVGKITQEQAEILWGMLEKFAGYGFNKSHSCAYAYITYQMAWLKTYYPTEFMAAVLTQKYNSNTKDREDQIAEALSACRAMGIAVAQPNINESRECFTVVSDSLVRFPIGAIHKVGEKALAVILENAPYANIEDLMDRLPARVCNKTVIMALILSGCFDSIVPNRIDLVKYVFSRRGDSYDPIIKFDKLHQVFLPEETEYTLQLKLDWEKLLLGTYISGHPLDAYDIPSWKGKYGNAVEAVGTVTSVRKTTVKNGRSAGETMAMGTLDTKDGDLHVVVFPEAYRECGYKLLKNNVVKVVGKLEQRNNEWQIVARNVTIPKMTLKTIT